MSRGFIKSPDPHLRHALYESLIMGKHHLPTVARRAGLGYDLLLKLCHGERHLLAEHLPAIYRGTQDIDLYSDLCGASLCDLLVTDRRESTGELRAPSTQTLKISAAVGALAAIVDEAEADGDLSEDERRRIVDALEVLERRVQSARRGVIKKVAG